MPRYFHLHHRCIPVKGYTRSTICDYERKELSLIPNGLFEIIEESKTASIEELLEGYDEESRQIVQEYLQFLLQKEFGYLSSQPQQTRGIPQEFSLPYEISNAIIDIDQQSKHNYAGLLAELDALGCKYLQLRSYVTLPPAHYRKLLAGLATTSISSIELITRYQEGVPEADWITLYNEVPQLVRLTIYSAPAAKRVDDSERLHFTTQQIDSCAACGVIHEQLFSIEQQTYLEGLAHNTCLNRKLSIDAAGQIKNCPSMQQSHGTAGEQSLREVILKKDFSKYWGLHKDQIEACQDCEFRRVCTDCRAYLSEPDNLYSKPAKCHYDPYQGIWLDEAEQAATQGS